MTVSGKTSREVGFTGDACGTKITRSLTLPRNAHSIRIVQPAVGDELGTGDEAVAKVVAVRVRGHRVEVVARGAFDPCDHPESYPAGWESGPVVVEAQYRRSTRVVVFNCGGNGLIRPSRIILACADANYQLTHMRWPHWGGHVARGHGYVYANDCIPFCAGGHFHSTPATVRLFRPRRCSVNGRWNYTRGYISERGERTQRWNFGYGCRLAGKVAAAATGYHPCNGGANPDGSTGDFYRGIMAHRVSCPAARRAVRNFAYYHSNSQGVPRVHSTTTTWGRWVCHSKFHQGADNGYENVHCHRGPGRRHLLRFYGAP